VSFFLEDCSHSSSSSKSPSGNDANHYTHCSVFDEHLTIEGNEFNRRRSVQSNTFEPSFLTSPNCQRHVNMKPWSMSFAVVAALAVGCAVFISSTACASSQQAPLQDIKGVGCAVGVDWREILSRPNHQRLTPEPACESKRRQRSTSK